MIDLKRCIECTLPETHETITFSNEGLCSVCQNATLKKEVDWDERNLILRKLLEKHRNIDADYDCIIPFSGGKDSTFTLYYVVNELKLKPLVVSFDHGFYRPNLIANREKVLTKLGVDFLLFRPNWLLVKQLMLKSFLDKGDFCWHCHTGIASYPHWVAVEKNIPLLIWGESSSEYTNYFDVNDFHSIDEVSYNRISNLGISGEDMFYRLKGEFQKRDFKPFTFPSLDSLKKIGYKSFPLGNYLKWDTRKQVEIIKKELDWQGDQVEGVPPQYDYEKIECAMQGVRDYIKYIKRGYARTTHLTSIDIRNDSGLDRETAMKLISEFEGKRPASLDKFLEYVGLSEIDFLEIAQGHNVDPWDGKVFLQTPQIRAQNLQE